MIRKVTHPGSVAPDRLQLVPCAGAKIEVELAAGVPLEAAVEQAMAQAGFASGWLVIEDAEVRQLSYVMPEHAPDNSHVAWYSDTHVFPDGGRIEDLGMIVGRHRGASFLHGHGRWTPHDGRTAMGHILARATVLAAPTLARGIGVRGAAFERLPDSETNFDLFQALGEGEEGDFALLRVRPNEDFTLAVETAGVRLGWSGASVHGVGSLNHASFDDGRTLDSLPTEFVVYGATVKVGGKTGPHLSIVGRGNTGMMNGRIARGQNAVLLTAEIILSRAD